MQKQQPNRVNENGHYVTEEGLPVTILRINAVGPYPVEGAVCMTHLPGNPLEPNRWTLEGGSEASGYNLREVPTDPFVHLPRDTEPPEGELEKNDPYEYSMLKPFWQDVLESVIVFLVAFFLLAGVFVMFKMIWQE
jgi:hypothetical protein